MTETKSKRRDDAIRNPKNDNRFGVVTSSTPFLTMRKAAEFYSSIPGVLCAEWVALTNLRKSDAVDIGASSHIDTAAFASSPVDYVNHIAGVINGARLSSTIGAYERILSENKEHEALSREHVLRSIDIASAMGGKKAGVSVSFFWGWDRKEGFTTNFTQLLEGMHVIASYAQEKNVAISTETCHMPGGWSTENDNNLPAAIMRNGSATYFLRRMVHGSLERMGISPETLGVVHDSSHAMTQMGDWKTQAELSFGYVKGQPKENIIFTHLKEHYISRAEGVIGAMHSNAGIPSVLMGGGTWTHKLAESLGLGDAVRTNGWAQGPGFPSLPGAYLLEGMPQYEVYTGSLDWRPEALSIRCDGEVTKEVIRMQKEAGIFVDVLVEDERPGKGFAVDMLAGKREDPNSALIRIERAIKDCQTAVAPVIYANGANYQGTKRFEEIVPAKQIEVDPSFDELKRRYDPSSKLAAISSASEV